MITKSPSHILAWGLIPFLLLLGGCFSATPSKRIPGYGMLPNDYPLYFSLNLNTLGVSVSEVMGEVEKLKALRPVMDRGSRLWGALGSPDFSGKTSVILEGNFASPFFKMGLTFDPQWKKVSREDYWQNEAGQQLSFLGGEFLLFSAGGMGPLLSLAKSEGPDLPLSPEEGRILEMGDLVIYGRDSGFLEELLPLQKMENLVNWSVILVGGPDNYPLLFSLTLGEEDAARALGTTLKLLFLGLRVLENTEEPVLADDWGLAGRLASGKIRRVGREVHIFGIGLSGDEFKALLGRYLKEGGWIYG